MKAFALVTLLFTCGAVAQWFFGSTNQDAFAVFSKSRKPSVEILKENPISAKEVDVAKPASANESSNAVVAKSNSTLPLDQPPTKNQILGEVRKDPHSAPESLVEFARSMGQPMHRALQNSSDAESLFPKLSECAMDKSGTRTRTLKAYCLANADILSQAHTGFSAPMDVLKAQVASEVILLASKLKNSSGGNKQ